MKLTFWGASRQVSGSMYLLELEDDYRILVDCGIDMERKDINPDDYVGLFPFEPSMLNLVVLTHAHIDHTGYLPNLLREGYEGKIIGTAATLALTKILLDDSASLNSSKLKKYQHEKRKFQKRKRKGFSNFSDEEETRFQNLAESAKGAYTQADVDDTMECFATVSINKKITIKKGVTMTMIPAGHLLGAVHIVFEVTENGETKSICFSGDIGRFNYPLLPDPEVVPQVDYLLCESTYGNRHHKDHVSPEEAIYETIYQTCVEKQGKLIVPAFSVGRTQALLYTLNRLRVQGKLPPIKIFSDSPLALKSTWIFQKYQSWLNDDAKKFAEEHGNLFDFENLTYVESMVDSKKLSQYKKPCIIISSSGMIQGGRVEYHVRQNIQNPNCTILLVGFAAEGTMGHALMHGAKVLEAKKESVPVVATVRATDVFSGHADVVDLMKFINYQDKTKLKKLFLVHGEEEIMQNFQNMLREEGFNASMPRRGETFEL